MTESEENPVKSNPEEALDAGTADEVGRKRRGVKAVLVLALAASLAGGGYLVAKATTDPTTSTQYQELAASSATDRADRDFLAEQIRQLKIDTGKKEQGLQTSQAETWKKEEDLKKREEDLKKREEAVKVSEQQKAANTVGDGTWVVGVDIEPGTYKVQSPVTSRCYWGIYASGTNGENIIANDIPGGGLPSVDLVAGQDFKSARCGSWLKQ